MQKQYRSCRWRISPADGIIPLYKAVIPHDEFIKACHEHWNVKGRWEGLHGDEQDPNQYQCFIGEEYKEMKKFQPRDYVILDLWSLWRQKNRRDFHCAWNPNLEAGMPYMIVERKHYSPGRYKILVRELEMEVHASCIIKAPSINHNEEHKAYVKRIFQKHKDGNLYKQMFGLTAEGAERLKSDGQKVINDWDEEFNLANRSTWKHYVKPKKGCMKS